MEHPKSIAYLQTLNVFVQSLDPTLEAIGGYQDQQNIVIKVKRKEPSQACPVCGHLSSQIHESYEREFDDVPSSGKKTKIRMVRRVFFCINAECKCQRFSEEVDFIEPRQKRTKRLNDMILSIAKHMSAVQAAKVISEQIVQITDDTILNLIKKKNGRKKITQQP